MNTKDGAVKIIIRRIQNLLSGETEIVFAYLHGSILSENTYNDIDVGIYIDETRMKRINPVDFQISLSIRLEKAFKSPVDVKIINTAPLSFRYNVSKGHLLFCRSDLIREDFLCRTWSEYFDFKPVSQIYLKEALIA